MKDSSLFYSVGALLYCPANNESIANSIINNRFGKHFSLALCLEDTINDKFVSEAEDILVKSLDKIYCTSLEKDFFMPKIFIRIRSPKQMQNIYSRLSDHASIVTGFIIPKFSPDNADSYIEMIIHLNDLSPTPVYMMPIYENSCLIDLRTRYNILYELKDKLDKIEDRVLNIRVGGNDLCHIYGFRRHDNESIHKIRPIANIFSDIITVYGTDYVVSGPVWEYFSGSNWKEGLKEELNDDILCGFTGKTVIHPNQIEVVNEAYKVNKNDLSAARSILNWDTSSHSYVSADIAKERMDELKTHTNWAKRILLLAENFGVKD